MTLGKIPWTPQVTRRETLHIILTEEAFLNYLAEHTALPSGELTVTGVDVKDGTGANRHQRQVTIRLLGPAKTEPEAKPEASRLSLQLSIKLREVVDSEGYYIFRPGHVLTEPDCLLGEPVVTSLVPVRKQGETKISRQVISQVTPALYEKLVNFVGDDGRPIWALGDAPARISVLGEPVIVID